MARPEKEPEVPRVTRMPRRPPAKTDEARERRFVASAFDLAEKQIERGTASPSIIVHALKLGSEREKLERERLERENELLRAKVEQLASAKNVEELYREALNAMRAYSGQEPMDEEEYDDY